MQLLLTAGLQEGLRQQILESADKGSAQTLARILKCCLDHELFRYSSAIRALDVWTGLPTDDARPARARRSGELAYAALTDAEKRKEFLQSEDLLQVYFALWGQACCELADSNRYTTCTEVIKPCCGTKSPAAGSWAGTLCAARIWPPTT